MKIIVLPPVQMVDSQAPGSIDGYYVGEPWNTVAVQHGIGSVLACGQQIWHNAIEKVLGVTKAWHNNHPSTHLRLRLAVMEACRWRAEHDNRLAAVDILARPEYLNLPARQLLPSLAGQFQFSRASSSHCCNTRIARIFTAKRRASWACLPRNRTMRQSEYTRTKQVQ